MSSPRVSIALLTRNGGATLASLLDGIERQRVPFEFEVVAVDSGSTDGTPERLAASVDRLERIDPAEFDHGATRNRAIALCRGELVALLVQDAVPVGEGWLGELAAPLLEDGRVAGSFARQLPRPDAGVLARRALERWIAGRDEPHASGPMTAEEFDGLSPGARMLAATFDNVCSCVRRSVWERIPFARTPIAEDLEWGREVLRAGHRLVYAPRAAVLHSHDRSLAYELGRTYLLHRRLHELFDVRLVPDRRALARSFRVTLPEHLAAARGELRRPLRALRTLGLALAWPYGQYLGGRAAAERRDLLRPRGI
jgi:rhamnosyltransferase